MMSPARQVGPPKTIGICLFTGFSTIFQRWAVWHFQYIRHMAGSGGVQDCNVHAIVQGFQHACYHEYLH